MSQLMNPRAGKRHGGKNRSVVKKQKYVKQDAGEGESYFCLLTEGFIAQSIVTCLGVWYNSGVMNRRTGFALTVAGAILNRPFVGFHFRDRDYPTA